MLFITGDAVAGTHGACIKLAAGAVVVAHLHRFGKALGGVAARAGGGGLLSRRVVLHVPRTPVQSGLNGNDFVVVAKAHQCGVVHLGWVDDALWRQQIQGV